MTHSRADSYIKSRKRAKWRRLARSWRFGLIGLGVAAYEGLVSVPDYSSLTARELLIRGSKIVAIALLGILGRSALHTDRDDHVGNPKE